MFWLSLYILVLLVFMSLIWLFDVSGSIHILGEGGKQRVIGISGALIWSKILMKLIFNPCCEFRWSLEGPVNQILSPHLHVGALGIFSDLLRYIQMLKREWGAESNSSYCTYSILGKTAALVPEFAVEDLPLADLQPRFLHFCPLTEHSDDECFYRCM